MDISGKVALVTGGASGLGAATARTIASAGGSVVILDLNDDLVRAIANAPYQARPGFFFSFTIEQWAPIATVNADFAPRINRRHPRR